MLKLRPLQPLPVLLGAALLLGTAADVHARPARSSAGGERAGLSRILDLGPVQALRDLFTSVWGRNGSQLDPHGGEGDNGAELDPNGSHSSGDNGAELDPHG